MELDKTLYYDKQTNIVVAGCSVKIQTLINFLADNNLRGNSIFIFTAGISRALCLLNADNF